MSGKSYRVTYRKQDGLGVADYVRDIMAVGGCRAIQQARWQLEGAHPDDHAAYEFWMCVRIERREPVEGAPA